MAQALTRKTASPTDDVEQNVAAAATESTNQSGAPTAGTEAQSPAVAATPATPASDTAVAEKPGSNIVNNATPATQSQDNSGAPVTGGVPDQGTIVPGTPVPGVGAKAPISEAVPGAAGPAAAAANVPVTQTPVADQPKIGLNANPAALTAKNDQLVNLLSNLKPTGNALLDQALQKVATNYIKQQAKPVTTPAAPTAKPPVAPPPTQANPQADFAKGFNAVSGSAMPAVSPKAREAAEKKAQEDQYNSENQYIDAPQFDQTKLTEDGSGGFNPFLESVPAIDRAQQVDPDVQQKEEVKKRRLTGGTSAVSPVVSMRTPALTPSTEEDEFNPYYNNIG